MLPKLLFICKRRNEKYGVSFGLINSCNFVCNALTKYNIESKTITVTDNNDIDREVSKYKPSHVFIEALWVVPEKFNVLIPLHPTVKWYVRLHSRMPFLANEGVAIEWLRKYDVEIQSKYPDNFSIVANNMDVIDTLAGAFGIRSEYYPNIYCPPKYKGLVIPKNKDNVIDIGCFGAIRPMKNHAYQALAAITFGNRLGRKIRFHINASRVEQKGESALKNIEKSFENTPHTLVKHEWMNHEDFIGVVKSMDIGMQVSFSESFNIVAADFVENSVPLVGSPEISWLSPLYQADPTKLQSIIETLQLAYYGKSINLHILNKWGLNRYNKIAERVWVNHLRI